MKSDKIHILFTIPNFKTAGSQYVLRGLISGLCHHTFRIYVAVENNEAFFPNAIAESSRIVLNYSGQVYYDTKYLRSVLINHKIDILHSWDYKSTCREVLACRIAGVKYVYTKKNNAWSKTWFLKSLLANHIAYDNPEMKKHFFSHYLLESKITFIPHGVDISKFRPFNHENSGSYNMCCIGNVVPNKNQLQIIEALQHLPNNVHLQLYGREDPTYRSVLDALIAKNNLEQRVHFHGFIENDMVPELLSKQDIFILASINEGLPVSILEALACGLPVLSSDSGGGSRYILAEGNGGYIFDSTADLVNHIKTIFESKSLYKKLSRAAVCNIETRFTLELEIDAYKALYLKLI